GEVEEGAVRLTEVHRFPNGPVRVPTGLHWDVLRLFQEVTVGIQRAWAYGPLASVGLDTWGVDFALLDRTGALLENPYHYRDPRTEGMLEEVTRRISRDELYRRTGIQFLSINTLVQLTAMAVRRAPALEVASTFLMVSDLINYWLTGEAVCEYTNATTTQCYDATGGTWAEDLLDRLGIPAHIFPRIVPPGTLLGTLHPSVSEDLGVPDVRVIAPACHDTASAVAAVPSSHVPFAYISSGTWSLVGTELARPLITPEAQAAGFTNEGGAFGTICFLRNVQGLWLLDESRRRWAQEG
ncbi:MAG: rhamnulokinase, partial [Thermoflexus sp.]